MQNAINRINELQQEIIDKSKTINGAENFVKEKLKLYEEDESLKRKLKLYEESESSHTKKTMNVTKLAERQNERKSLLDKFAEVDNKQQELETPAKKRSERERA